MNLKSLAGAGEGGIHSRSKALNLTPPRASCCWVCRDAANRWQRKPLRANGNCHCSNWMRAGYSINSSASPRKLSQDHRMAESLSPIVLWIDEVKGDGGGRRQRRCGCGLEPPPLWRVPHLAAGKKQDVFVVPTANNLSALPPRLLRKGRFDEIFFRRPTGHSRTHGHLEDPSQPSNRTTPGSIFRKSWTPAKDSAARKSSRPWSPRSIAPCIAKEPLTTDLLLEEISYTVPLSVTRVKISTSCEPWPKGRFVNVR